MLKTMAKNSLRLAGFELTRLQHQRHAPKAWEEDFPDLSEPVKSIINRARPHTMTSIERLAALCSAVEYVTKNDVPGSLVECGVWQGGSSMAAALMFLDLGRDDVDMFLFDTFEGMSEPTAQDVAPTGETAQSLLDQHDKRAEVWCVAPLEVVRKNMAATRYPEAHIHYVKGKVEETISATSPEHISILRLDTDWYESTKHELEHLYPRLSKNGILIIDDYGHWAGARKAVDEYFSARGMVPFLHRIDYTGRIYIKP